MGALDAQIPNLKPVASAPSQRNLRFSPDTFGAGVGDTIARVGDDFNRLVQADIAERIKEDTRKAGTAYNRAVIELGALEDEYSQATFDEADKQFDSVMKRRDAIRAKYTEGLSAEQQALFDEDYTQAAMRFDGRVTLHRTKQAEALELANAEGRLGLMAAEAARTGGDPAQLAELSRAFDEQVAKIAVNKGLPAGSDAERGFLLEHKGKFHAGVVASMLAKDDIGAAQQYLDAYGDEIPVEVASRVQNEVQAAAKRAQAEREASMPFELSDMFFDPNKSETEIKQAIRDYGEQHGLKASTIRSALSDVNSRFSDLAAEKKSRVEQLSLALEYGGKGNYADNIRTPEGQAIQRELAGLAPDVLDTISRRASTRSQLPVEDQQQALMRLRADMNDPSKNKDDVRRAAMEKGVLNMFDDKNRLIAVSILDGTEKAPEAKAVPIARSWLTQDFGKKGDMRSAAPEEEQYIIEHMQQWEENLYRTGALQEGKPVPVEAVRAEYVKAKTRMIDARGQRTTYAKLFGTDGKLERGAKFASTRDAEVAFGALNDHLDRIMIAEGRDDREIAVAKSMLRQSPQTAAQVLVAAQSGDIDEVLRILDVIERETAAAAEKAAKEGNYAGVLLQRGRMLSQTLDNED